MNCFTPRTVRKRKNSKNDMENNNIASEWYTDIELTLSVSGREMYMYTINL